MDRGTRQLSIEETVQEFLEEETRIQGKAPKSLREDLDVILSFTHHHLGAELWDHVEEQDWREFAACFFPHKYMPRSPREAKRVLNTLRKLLQWLDQRYGTRFYERYEPVYRVYSEALPHALKAKELLRQWLGQSELEQSSLQAAVDIVRRLQVSENAFLLLQLNLLLKEGPSRSDVREALIKLKELLQALEDPPGTKEVDGYWEVVHVTPGYLTLKLEGPPHRKVTVEVPHYVSSLLGPGFRIYGSVAVHGLVGQLREVWDVYPPA